MRNKRRKSRQASRTEAIPNASFVKNSTPRSSTDGQTGRGPKSTVQVDFLELEDGTLVEMIEDPNDPTKSLIATCNNGQIRQMEKLERGHQVFVPISRDADIVGHVRLAKGTTPYGSALELFAGILRVLRATLELSIEQELLLSAFVLSTWLVEKLPVAPYLAFVGPPASGKTTALRILSLLCRRGLMTADISSAAFYEICNRMTTTLLIDETATVDNRRKLLHLLRSGTTQDFVAVRKGKTYKSYGARVVSWIEPPDDAALNSRCLLIPMKSCKRMDLLLPNDPRVLQLAEMLQRGLLQFRLMNYKTLTLPRISGEEELQPRTRDLFRALALPLAEEKESYEALLLLLKRQESLRNVLPVEQSAVLECLYEVIHSFPELNGLRIVALTENVNANLRGRGESGKLSEKKVSNILTSLHLTNRTRTNVGFVLLLSRETREEIHSQACTYGANAGLTPKLSAGCELCQIASERPTSGSTTKPIKEKESERIEVSAPRERSEHRERGKRRTIRKSAVLAARLRRLKKRKKTRI